MEAIIDVAPKSNDKACVVCNRIARKENACVWCKAVYYCSEKCRQGDLACPCSNPDNNVNSHQFWCSRLAKYSTDADIISFPFTWTTEVTHVDFNGKAYEKFLHRYGITSEGFWLRELPMEQSLTTPYGELDVGWNPFILPVESTVLDDTSIPAPPSPLRNWKDYYEWRGFYLDSPICVLLQWPLTVYYILLHCLRDDYASAILPADLSNDGATAVYVIHCIGVAKEADLFPILGELSVLMPSVQIDFHLVGPAVSKSVDGRTHTLGEHMTATLHSGLYHNLFSTLPTPHIALGFNAGLVAFTSWIETLNILAASKIPSYFTEYCWKSYEHTRIEIDKYVPKHRSDRLLASDHLQRNAGSSLSAVNRGIESDCTAVTGCAETDYLGTAKQWSVSDGCLNPFRSPIRIYDAQSDVPAFSNAIIFHLGFSCTK